MIPKGFTGKATPKQPMAIGSKMQQKVKGLWNYTDEQQQRIDDSNAGYQGPLLVASKIPDKTSIWFRPMEQRPVASVRVAIAGELFDKASVVYLQLTPSLWYEHLQSLMITTVSGENKRLDQCLALYRGKVSIPGKVARLPILQWIWDDEGAVDCRPRCLQIPFKTWNDELRPLLCPDTAAVPGMSTAPRWFVDMENPGSDFILTRTNQEGTELPKYKCQRAEVTIPLEAKHLETFIAKQKEITDLMFNVDTYEDVLEKLGLTGEDEPEAETVADVSVSKVNPFARE